MSEQVHVTVSSYGANRKHLMMRYTDPITGKRHARSTGTANRRDAERAAGRWEVELREGCYESPSRITWEQFRDRYESEHLPSLAAQTQEAAMVSLGQVERVINPDRLAKLTTDQMSRFQARLRDEGMQDNTIAHHLRHIKAALNWAVRLGMLGKAPKIEMPKRAKGKSMMRGRPVTGEEFERMLAAVPEVRPHDPGVWQRYLTGLWLSGLRLGESMILSWDGDAPFAIDLSGRRPRFRIYAEGQKAHRDQLLPMTPDFAEWILQTPEDEREGRVFKLEQLNTGKRLALQVVGRIVSKIGKQAGVVVTREPRWVREKVKDPRTGEATGETQRVKREVPKYASAHDLRRAFGTRWAPRVKQTTLQLLMRHAAIETTLRFYVDQDADDVADELWAGGFRPGNTSRHQPGKRGGGLGSGNTLATPAEINPLGEDGGSGPETT